MTIRVAIVDDHALIRQGLKTLLIEMGMEVVGEAASGQQAIQLAEEQTPDVMLLDIRMKDCDGLTALPQIKAASAQTQVIILTTYSNPAYFSQAVRNGAAGYLLKESEPEDIVDAIQAAAARNHLFDPNLLSMVVGGGDHETPQPAPMPQIKTEPPGIEPISDREYDVLRLLAQGMSNAEIAKSLNVSVTTIKTHVTHILRKLDVNDRTQAVVVAMRHGLVT